MFTKATTPPPTHEAGSERHVEKGHALVARRVNKASKDTRKSLAGIQRERGEDEKGREREKEGNWKKGRGNGVGKRKKR